MNAIQGVHHVAIICSDYEKSKAFYTEVLGLEILAENYRANRQSWKLDLALNGQYCLELFSFPDTPKRPSRPEASGLRHIAFGVNNLDVLIQELQSKGIQTEVVRIDEYTEKRFTFLSDPDDLPLELYELD